MAVWPSDKEPAGARGGERPADYQLHRKTRGAPPQSRNQTTGCE